MWSLVSLNTKPSNSWGLSLGHRKSPSEPDTLVCELKVSQDSFLFSKVVFYFLNPKTNIPKLPEVSNSLWFSRTG